MRTSSLVITLLIGALLAGTPTPAHAEQQFIVDCLFAHRAKDDPIVYPRQPGASHMHDFFGNKSTNAFSTYRSMLRSRTNCDMAGETAAYWAPTLVRGDGTIVTPRRIKIYYRSGLLPGRRTYPYPKNFRMIAHHPRPKTDLQTFASLSSQFGTCTEYRGFDLAKERLLRIFTDHGTRVTDHSTALHWHV